MDIETSDSSLSTIEIDGEIRVFSIRGCPFCKRAKAFLSSKDLPYLELNISSRPDKRKALIEKTGCFTVPQIFFNEKYVGGCDDLLSLSAKDLVQLIDFVRITPPIPDPFFSLEGEPKEEDQGYEIVCEPDPLLKIAQEMKSSKGGVRVKARQYHLKTYKNVFVGKTAVSWFIEKGYAQDTQSALKLGNDMMEKHIFHHCKYDHSFKNEELFYRFLEDEKTKSLNVPKSPGAEAVSSCEPIEASNLSGLVRRLILQLYEKHLSRDGTSVDYESIGNDPQFSTYCQLVAELQRVQIREMAEKSKLSFFINIYNSLVIHAQVVKGHPTTSWKRYRFFNRISYRIGGHDLTLNDIENGILRGNKTPPFSFSVPFSGSDPRRPFALPEAEPRIHFALNCGAQSCPPIKVYDEENIDEQLTASAQAFLNESALQVNVIKKEISLTKIFDWYRSDFGKTDENIILWSLLYLSPDKRNQVEQLLLGKSYKVVFQTYNWTANSSK
eukprot:CAMPEP_0201478982 /NCGR_PEP_ID=MMETSP0151_2-20130828/3734_1 /ASSEMBLY_ACC=CAM_ASM_000257 /TAXON_ID=200890 /ORGANISM="Paramoeba atlantica, Strain 621/1 / CCAP 1560/9" /LENGTH=496 /DNA_ID=CAMNT_0047860273 /DNA_START=93 /DNA_END=1583 /DNA_ORIENTATION=+